MKKKKKDIKIVTDTGNFGEENEIPDGDDEDLDIDLPPMPSVPKKKVVKKKSKKKAKR